MFRLIFSSSVSATLSVVFATVITIWAENSPALKDWLKSISGHHWTTKSLFVAGLYLLGLTIVYAVSQNVGARTVRRSVYFLVSVSVIAFLAILIFYLLHYL